MKQIIYVTSSEDQKIHVLDMNNQGILRLLQMVDLPGQGQPLAIHPDKTHLYVGVRPIPSVISYHVDKTGLLTKVGVASLPGSPTQLTTDLRGNTLYSVSYKNSCLSVSPIDKKGIVCFPTQTLEGLEHCHSANVDLTNKVLWVPCLKENRIRLYAIDDFGYLKPLKFQSLDSTPGSGPRHMVFHHSGKYVYVINEFSGTVNVILTNFLIDSPSIVQTLDIMPANFRDTPWAADIHITPNGRWLYCCDRAASIITCFSVSEDGAVLNLVSHQKTESQPRSFNIDASGSFLVIAGQKSHHISVYNINQKSGKLTLLERYAVGKNPTWVDILQIC